ncbi:MFS transporter [Salinibacterium sp. dk2585]|uniref:MFS transporter n=1 Tax=unclassified Salinibacterium TaxID=2632331 RepID=UPI0011C24E92|nr:MULTISPECIES: MFS transporter [unclassified Salinibacterium]QEE61901.1 MFS transporter [Salinibacterium sp. dk2585]TXK54544.1 MFS transporter [Salinibacterium sp. dk5596]
MSKIEGLYSALLRRNQEAEAELPAEVRRNVAPNGLRLVLANALQSSGDQVVNASTVLPWLFSALGVPSALVGVLVPIRESGSMLPQAFLTPIVLRARRRKWVFVAGALVQALSVAAIALTAALGEGLGAGIAIIVALAVFSLGRCLCSISSKDVQGRTVPKGERGQINGVATAAAGLVAITLGVAIRVIGGEELAPGQLAWLLAGGAALWVLVAVVYAGIREPADDPQQTSEKRRQDAHWFGQMVRLLRDDRPFRSFVLVRSLLLVSALSPPFIVSLSIESGSNTLAGLGGFIIASGLAALLGGRLFGRLADRSSKRLMSVGAGIASAVIVLTVVVAALPGFTGEGWLGTLVFIGSYFVLTMMHTGVRVGRKTYIVDMAEGDKRTAYVAVSNTAMGVILLAVGGISSLLAAAHIFWALLFLAAMGLVGVFAGARLPEVSRRSAG